MKPVMNKRAQFFILSAVIIAAIIVSMATVKNSITTVEAPAKFYYYSQQLNDETGATVDYALYTGKSTTVEDFLQQGLSNTMTNNPGVELFSCYSNTTKANTLNCQNNGTRSVGVNTTKLFPIYLSGTMEKICDEFGDCEPSSRSIDIKGKNFLTINTSGQIYNIPLVNSSIQTGQFYFIMRMNTSGGSEYVATSGVQA